MLADLLQIFLAFLEGIILIISPCILPILPILFAGGISGGKRRPIGIILGFVLTFSLFTLFIRLIIHFTHINLDYLRYVAYFLLLLFGLIMMSNYLFRRFEQLTSSFMSITFSTKSTGFWSGFLLGMLLSIIWTPCAGPIFAAAIVQIAIQKSFFQSFLVLLFFALGTVLPMMLIVLVGRKFILRSQTLQQKSIVLRKLLGLVIIISVLLMMFGNYFNLSLPMPPQILEQQKPANVLIDGIAEPYSAPELKNISGWINTKPISIQSLKGKVILIDFWTYSCINCVRSLPYLIAWYNKYHNDGLVIIGVHTPEFEFEKNYANVKSAVEKFAIPYPVVLDNDFATWLNYRNQNWPTHYLINRDGKVVYTHIGEGDYDITENNIRYLLGMRTPVQVSYRNAISAFQTPETYLGFARMNNFASVESVLENRVVYYHYPNQLAPNQWALQGMWLIQPERIISAQKLAAIKLRFRAKNIYAVMGSITQQPIKVTVVLNNQSLKNEINVSQHRLYEIISFLKITTGTIELIADQPGVELYTFTFGS